MGGIAQDFKNLLSLILGQLDLAHLRYRQQQPGVEKSIEAAIRAAQRGARLTKSLLTFTHKHPLHPQYHQLHLLLEQFRPLLEKSIPQGITLLWNIAPPQEAQHQVFIDAHHLQQKDQAAIFVYPENSMGSKSLGIFSKSNLMHSSIA